MAFPRMIPLGASSRVWTQSGGTVCFLSWVQAINTVLPAKPIAIDGKTARRSHDRGAGKAAIQMVSAWAAETHLVLAQRHVKEQSNEQTALPLLLEQLELAGCIVSIDAMGCLPKIATQIKAQDGDYVLALKGNQGTMYQDVVDLFADVLATGFAELVHDTHHTIDKGHGRLEHRQYWTISDPACIAYLNAKQTWTGLHSIGMGDRGTQSGPAGVQRTPLLPHEPAGGCASLWRSRAQPLEGRNSLIANDKNEYIRLWERWGSHSGSPPPLW
jgi:predicted transposase YbfD/YdcC